MSTSIENLRQLAARDVKDHTAIFDSYVVLGREIDYLAIKFGLDPDKVVDLLEGYGECIRRQPPQVVGIEEMHEGDSESASAKPQTSEHNPSAGRKKARHRSLFANPFRIDPEEDWATLRDNPQYDTSGCGRLGNLPRFLVEEYVEKFYPGIAAENPQNDWINIDSYLQMFHAGWASRTKNGKKE